MPETPPPDCPIVRRAVDYPYDGHDGSFLFRAGAVETAAHHRLPRDGRVPVLAYGSNKAPAQLARKFADDRDGVAVQQVRAAGCDVVFCARFSSYGTLPAMLHAMPQTTITVAVTWLTEGQLAAMDHSEGVTIGNYRRVTLPFGTVTDADGAEIAGVQVYDSDHPPLHIGGAPVALDAIAAEGRVLPAMTTAEALDRAHGHLSPDVPRDAAIRLTVDDAGHRVEMSARLRAGLPAR